MLRARLDLRQALADEAYAIEESITLATADATMGLKEDLREQVVSAGLGTRLSKTWRAKAYPERGHSLAPAGFVWSKSPRIVIAFNNGGSIGPRRAKFLAIPTKNVPAARGRGRQQRNMSPEEVEAHFNQDLTMLPGKNGAILGFVRVVAARSRRRPGYRQATKRRLTQGRAEKMVHMFTFVRRVKMPKLLDLQAAADRWAGKIPVFFARRKGRR